MYYVQLLLSYDRYIHIGLFQMSAEIQDYLTNRITKGHVPSYQLYLHLNDVLKLATSIPPKYVCMTVFMYTYCTQMSTI